MNWMINNDYEKPNPNLVRFDMFIMEQYQSIQDIMAWNNYDLNETVIPVVDLLKGHAVQVLVWSYGDVLIDPQEFLPPFLDDLFTFFPVLMQELAITRLMDSQAVNTHDQDSTEFTRTETLKNESDNVANLNSDVNVNENGTQNATRKDTGTSTQEDTNTGKQDSNVNITNGSNVATSNSHNVDMSHALPEQALETTGNFPIGEDGIPDLSTSYVQSASENFSSATPIITDETSNQVNTGTSESTGNSTTTNDLTTTDSGTNTRISDSKSVDTSDSKTVNKADNTIVERTDVRATNKQYSYEITNFLSAVSSVIAFRNFENRFSWIRGIL